MARKIDLIVSAAFAAGRPVSVSNTVVKVSGSLVRCYLHGNLIAEKNTASGAVRFQSCGWDTVTTKARLNACGLDCVIRSGRLVTFPDLRPVPSRF